MGTGKERDAKYTIPRKDVVVAVVMDILNEAMTIRSQTLFHRLVTAKLREMGMKRFRLSPRRLRMITAKLDSVDLLIYCREGDRRSRRSLCPVCGDNMIDIRNSTLYGWEVSTGKACRTCSYWTGSRERIPTRYVFTLEKEKVLGETMETKG